MKKPLRLGSLLVLMIGVVAGCACRDREQHDVTHDPDFKFNSVLDHLYLTRREMSVYDRGGMLALATGGPGASAPLPIAVLPKGTILRPIQLSGEFCQTKTNVVVVRIETGAFAGRKAAVESSELFFDPTRYAPAGQMRVTQWEANPLYLEPARE